MLSTIAFVTSEHKHREAQAILGVALERVALDLPEPQGLDVAAVASTKARLAYERLRRPVLVEDTSLELEALGGFPGPLIRWLLEAAGVAAIPRLLDGFASRAAPRPLRRAGVRRRARALRGRRRRRRDRAGSRAAPPGSGGTSSSCPDWGGGRTYAEMPAEEKNARSHRALAFRELAGELAKGQ